MIKNYLFLIFLLLASCQKTVSDSEPQGMLMTPYGDSIKTMMALSEKRQRQGLSGVRPEDFKDNEAIFFYYLEDGERHFWMPDTYFDLDIIYLDQNLKIVDIIRRMPHYIGKDDRRRIPRARPVWARHAFEMKAGSKISQKLKVGDQLNWKGDLSLQQIELKTRQLQSLPDVL